MFESYLAQNWTFMPWQFFLIFLKLKLPACSIFLCHNFVFGKRLSKNIFELSIVFIGMKAFWLFLDTDWWTHIPTTWRRIAGTRGRTNQQQTSQPWSPLPIGKPTNFRINDDIWKQLYSAEKFLSDFTSYSFYSSMPLDRQRGYSITDWWSKAV